MTNTLRRRITAAASAAAATVALTGIVATGASRPQAEHGSTVATSTKPVAGHRVPALARAWARAWRSEDSSDLAALFTKDGVYVDHAAEKTSRGRTAVAAWEAGTHQLIAGVDIDLKDAFRDGDRVLIRGVYQGHIAGAPHAFAVPIATVLNVRGHRIERNADYYSLSTLLRQSGLPPTWQPPVAPAAPARQ